MLSENLDSVALKLRDWVKAQIEAAIVDNEEDSEGYRGSGYSENKLADELFIEFSRALCDIDKD